MTVITQLPFESTAEALPSACSPLGHAGNAAQQATHSTKPIPSSPPAPPLPRPRSPLEHARIVATGRGRVVQLREGQSHRLCGYEATSQSIALSRALGDACEPGRLGVCWGQRRHGSRSGS